MQEDPNLTNIPVPEGAKELEIYLEIHPVDFGILGGAGWETEEGCPGEPGIENQGGAAGESDPSDGEHKGMEILPGL